jgi:hypothetical protein
MVTKKQAMAAITAVSPVMTLMKHGSQIAKKFGSNVGKAKVKPSLSDNLAGGIKKEKSRVQQQNEDMKMIMEE